MRAATEYTVARMASLRVGKQRFEGHAIMTIKAVDHGRTAEGVFTLGSDVTGGGARDRHRSSRDQRAARENNQR
jgi:hypothetical protein